MTISTQSRYGWKPDEPLQINGVWYYSDWLGVIHQRGADPFAYDERYIRRAYGAIPKTLLEKMARLRLGLLTATAGSLFGKNVLEIGYGCGAFLEAANRVAGIRTYGHEINGMEPPPDTIVSHKPFEATWDAVCMFDVLEHLPDLAVMETLRTKWLMVTVPYCHARVMGPEWFAGWKHRKPNEHLHHFDAAALCMFLHNLGYSIEFSGSPEDAIRRPVDCLPNTLTVIAKS